MLWFDEERWTNLATSQRTSAKRALGFEYRDFGVVLLCDWNRILGCIKEKEGTRDYVPIRSLDIFKSESVSFVSKRTAEIVKEIPYVVIKREKCIDRKYIALVEEAVGSTRSIAKLREIVLVGLKNIT